MDGFYFLNFYFYDNRVYELMNENEWMRIEKFENEI